MPESELKSVIIVFPAEHLLIPVDEEFLVKNVHLPCFSQSPSGMWLYRPVPETDR